MTRTKPSEAAVFDLRMVGYARVSTLDQSLDMQLKMLRDAGVSDGNLFVEKVSAQSGKRPQFALLKKFLQRGDTLVVYAISRLARNTKDLLDFNKWLLDEGVALKSLTEEVDTRTATGRLMFTLHGALAQYERDKTIERTRDGIRARRETGFKWGRPSKKTPQLVDQMKRDLLTMTVAQVAKKHNVSAWTVKEYTGGARKVLRAAKRKQKR